MVFTAAQPFSSTLVMSNINNFRYEWVWVKDRPNNFALANKRPMNYHEVVLVFYRKLPVYNKIMEERTGTGKEKIKYLVDNSKHKSDHLSLSDKPKYYEELKNPSSVQHFSMGRRNDSQHPTQKPVELFKYLINTYTNEGDYVLDNTAGSGTTAVAAIETNRKFICIEKDKKYFKLMNFRIEESYKKKKILGKTIF